MKKIFSLILILSLFNWSTWTSFAAFSDVPSSHPNTDAIEYVQSEGIVKGYADGTYKPDQHINRAEFLKIIVLAITGQEPLEHAGSCFSDVSSGVWFYAYVCYAERVGIVGGYPDGSFQPANNITFVEAAKIIVIALDYPFEPGEPWFKPYVDVLAENKAIPMTISDFSQQITRGEMAEMIYRLKSKLTNKPSQSYESLAGIETPEEENSPETKTFNVTARQFDFAPSTMTVNQGDTVQLIVTSEDVEHGLALPQFNINESIPAGETVTIEFVADQKGSFRFFCSVFCGSGHGHMEGNLIVE